MAAAEQPLLVELVVAVAGIRVWRPFLAVAVDVAGQAERHFGPPARRLHLVPLALPPLDGTSGGGRMCPSLPLPPHRCDTGHGNYLIRRGAGGSRNG